MSGVNRAIFHPGGYPLLRIAILYAMGIVAGRYLFEYTRVYDFPVQSARLAEANTLPEYLAESSTLPAYLAGSQTLTTGVHLFPATEKLSPDITLWLFAGVAFLSLFSFFVLATNSHSSRILLKWKVSIVPMAYLISIAGFGMLQSYRHHIPKVPDELVLRYFEPDDLTFFGSVLSDRLTRTGNRLLTVAVDSVHINGLPEWRRPFRSEVMLLERYWLESQGSAHPPATGAYLHFKGNLETLPLPRNPNQFDYASFLSRQGIYSRIFVSTVDRHVASGSISFWINQRMRIRAYLSRLFSVDNAGLARAIILGDRSGLDTELRTAFSRAGLAHLMAVSGMHVGFVLLPVWFILPWFRKSGLFRFTGLVLGGSLLFAYAGLTGFSVSVSRASLMAFFLMIARLFHKPGTSMNILGAAAFLLLLIDPLMLFDVGFQLSFIAVIIILTLLPGTRYLLPPHHRYRKTGALFQFVMVSVLVQGGLYPLLVYYFQEFSVAGPLSNTLAVPFVQFMFLWSFASLGLSAVAPSSAVLMNTPGDFILTNLTRYVEWISSQPSSYIETTLPGLWIFGIWFFGIAALASVRIPGLRWKMTAAMLVSILFFQMGRAVEMVKKPVLTITFYDVGQGDAVLLQTPGGLRYLYDAGVWSPTSNSAERVLLPELKAMGIRKLDGVILSHPHADHIGGIVALIENMPIDTIYQSPAVYDSRLYHTYMSLASERNIPVRLLQTGDVIATDPAMPMLALAPSVKIPAQDPNNQSVVLMVLYGNNRMLLTGDAEKEAEDFLIYVFGDFLQSELLKVGHHASKTSSTQPFLSHVNARYAVASLGLRNRYNHPHPEATSRLIESEVKVLYTSLEGAVIFRTDGNRFNLVPWKY